MVPVKLVEPSNSTHGTSFNVDFNCFDLLTEWPPFWKELLHVQLIVCSVCLNITKTCPCNVYPPEPHFLKTKLGYAGVYLFFLFLLQNMDCGYSLEPPRRGGSNMYPQSMF